MRAFSFRRATVAMLLASCLYPVSAQNNPHADGAAAAPDAAFSRLFGVLLSHGPIQWRTVWGHPRGCAGPVSGSPTPHGLPPLLAKWAVVQTCTRNLHHEHHHPGRAG